MDEVISIPAADIQDKWPKGVMEECDSHGLTYIPKQRTVYERVNKFLEIPVLHTIIGGSTACGAICLQINPDERPLSIEFVYDTGKNPRDTAKDVINKRMEQMKGVLYLQNLFPGSKTKVVVANE